MKKRSGAGTAHTGRFQEIAAAGGFPCPIILSMLNLPKELVHAAAE